MLDVLQFIFSPHFRRNTLRSICLLYVINETVDYMTENLSTVNLCFVDLIKAFDNINHFVLFNKLLRKRVPICLI